MGSCLLWPLKHSGYSTAVLKLVVMTAWSPALSLAVIGSAEGILLTVNNGTYRHPGQSLSRVPVCV